MSLTAANASRWRGQPGHYEAWHVRAADPGSAAAAWIRMGFTVPAEDAPGDPLAEVWFLGRDHDGAVYARRETFSIDELQTGAGGFPINLGRSALRSGRADGTVDAARWELRWEPESASLDWGGESRFRRTEIAASQPALTISGTIVVGAEKIAVEGWPGHQLHAWGSRHAEESARMHCSGLPAVGDFLEAVTRRGRRRGALLPSLTMGAARVGGRVVQAHDVARGLVSAAAFGADGYEFTVRTGRASLWGRVRCSPADLLGVAYRDPDGGRVFAYQTDRADLEMRVGRRGPRGWKVEARVDGRCAYEYSSRKPVSGVEVLL